MQTGIKVFQALSVKDHPTIIDDKHSPDLSNILVNNPIGALSNMEGTEKYNSVGFGNPIVAIHQLNGHIFSLKGGTAGSASGKLTEGYPTYASAPVANAGVDQSKGNSETVTLDGSASERAVSYLWTQTSGTTVTLSDTTAISPTFTMPAGDVTFQLEVTNYWGSDTDTVDITNITVYIYAGRTNESSKRVAYGGQSEGIWEQTEAAFNADPAGGWTAPNWYYRLGFAMYFWYDAGSGTPYQAIIEAHKAQITRDLSGYDPNDYVSAHLVVKPTKSNYDIHYGLTKAYYNEHGWIEDEYNFLEDITSELGTNWTSTDIYGPPFTTSKPSLGTEKGWDAGGQRTYQYKFYIELIPKT